MKLKLSKIGDAPSDLSGIIQAAFDCPQQYDIIIVAHAPNPGSIKKPVLYLERLCDASEKDARPALHLLMNILEQNMIPSVPKPT